MSRFYGDEHFPPETIEALRELGHDVLTALQDGKANQKIPDKQVLDRATSLGRTVLTINRSDFKELHRLDPNHAGIVSCTEDTNRVALAERIDQAVKGQVSLKGEHVRVNRPNPTLKEGKLYQVEGRKDAAEKETPKEPENKAEQESDKLEEKEISKESTEKESLDLGQSVDGKSTGKEEEIPLEFEGDISQEEAELLANDPLIAGAAADLKPGEAMEIEIEEQVEVQTQSEKQEQQQQQQSQQQNQSRSQ